MAEPIAASPGAANTDAFLEAARTGDLESLKTLAKAFCEEKKNVAAVRDLQMSTPLHIAANNGDIAVCTYLLEKLKLRVDATDHYGETPLFKAVTEGHVETAAYLLDKGAAYITKRRSGCSMLHIAAKIGNIQLMELLLQKGANIESISNGGTPLTHAVRHGQIAAVTFLLQSGANANAGTGPHNMPLAAAIAKGSFACFEALIQGGAEITGIKLPLHYAASCGGDTRILEFLLHTFNPNESDDDGLKPIQIAALNNMCEAVHLLLPRTTPIPSISKWTAGAIKKQTLSRISEEKAETEKQRDADLLSDEEITSKLEKMLVAGEDSFFENWSSLKRRLFYKSAIRTLPNPRLARCPVGPVQNSTLFDTTSDDVEKLQSNYLRAICHYRAWQFAGSEQIYEYGNDGKKFCVARKDQTFIFWFRDRTRDVGVVIDGRRIWAEGFIRRTLNEDLTFSYNGHIIQFCNESSDQEGESSSSAAESQSEHKYMEGKDVEVVTYSGTYKESVTRLQLHVHRVRVATSLIWGYKKKDPSFKETCHEAADTLILYSTEAGKNHWIFQYTMASLDISLVKPIRIPVSLHATVVKHKKVTLNAHSALQREIEESAIRNENDDWDSTTITKNEDSYEIVRGAPFRSLSQCVEAYCILSRQKGISTRFFLPKEWPAHPQSLPSRARLEAAAIVPDAKKTKVTRKQSVKDQTTEEALFEETLRRGTTFRPEQHGGDHIYQGDITWPMPPDPSGNSLWFHCDDLAVS